jgi:hypothetical protein
MRHVGFFISMLGFGSVHSKFSGFKYKNTKIMS